MMNPTLRIESDYNGTVAHLNPQPHGSSESFHIGCLISNLRRNMFDWGKIGNVYQLGSVEGWCVSLWGIIPDALWWVRGKKEILLVRVNVGCLDFRNTAFEHRYNLRVNRVNNVENSPLNTLAKMERQMWGKGYKEFVPFKSTHPQGYKGMCLGFEQYIVYGDGSICAFAQDKFESGIHSLIEGWN